MDQMICMQTKMHRTKRQIHAEETKRRIYEAGVKAISEKGLDSVSIEDITTAANVAKGSFYTHFHSKADLVYSTIAYSDEIYEQMYQQVRELSFLPMITQFVRLSYTEYEKRGKGIIKAMVSNYFTQPERNYYGKDRILVCCLTEIVEKGRAEGLLSTETSAHDYAMVLLSAMVGVEIMWCFDQKGQKLADMMEQAIRITALGMIR